VERENTSPLHGLLHPLADEMSRIPLQPRDDRGSNYCSLLKSPSRLCLYGRRSPLENHFE